MRVAGRAVPVQHRGSVDVFFEAIDDAGPGDVVVVDNAGRLDEACVGDLAGIEAQAAGMEGILIWGAHRDTAQLQDLEFPVFSYGCVPTGPTSVRKADVPGVGAARFGPHVVTADDAVVADADGAVFFPWSARTAVIAEAEKIVEREAEQARLVAAGTTLRDQLRFAEYVERRAADPEYTFRRHLRRLGGEIEQ